MVRMETIYLIETEIFLMKILYIKIKISWNSIVKLINNTKKYSETYE